MFSTRAILVSLPFMIWNLVLGSDVTNAVNCAACQYLDGPWNSWECRVQCSVAPEGVQIVGEYWMVPGTHGSVEYNAMCHQREFRLWASIRWSLNSWECRVQCNVAPERVQIMG